MEKGEADSMTQLIVMVYMYKSLKDNTWEDLKVMLSLQIKKDLMAFKLYRFTVKETPSSTEWNHREYLLGWLTMPK